VDKERILAAFDKFKTDKGTLLHEYHTMYSEIFNKMGTITKMLEVGVLDGRSLAAWCSLFPDTEIVGVDKKRRYVHDAAVSAKFFVGDSTKETISNIVGNGYDLIIDDGDHDVDSQWLTFTNLRDCWTKAYVIEDIYGKDLVDILTTKLYADGFTNVVIYSSKKKFGRTIIKGITKTFDFFSIVVYKDF